MDGTLGSSIEHCTLPEKDCARGVPLVHRSARRGTMDTQLWLSSIFECIYACLGQALPRGIQAVAPMRVAAER